MEKDTRTEFVYETTLSDIEALMDSRVRITTRINPGEPMIWCTRNGDGHPGEPAFASIQKIELVGGNGAVADLSNFFTAREDARLAEEAMSDFRCKQEVEP